MPTSWAQKRAQIAQALAGGGGSGWGGFGQSIGAGIMANPMLGNQGAGGQGLFGGGPSQGQQMAQANASLQGAPGFDYVPPSVGPAPAPAAAAGTVGGPWTRDDRMAFLRGRPTQANQMAYTQALGQGAYDNLRQGNNRYRR